LDGRGGLEVTRLGVLYNGALPEQRLLSMPQYEPYFAGRIYLPQIADFDLSEYNAIVVPEGTHHRRLQDAAPQLNAFLQRGGTLLAFGDQPIPWHPSLDWEFRVARRPERDELVHGSPEHAFHATVGYDDIYHHHGIFHAPEGSEPPLSTPDRGAVVYIDRVSTPGTLFVTSMDLFVHAATQSNPLSYRFLDRFLPWVCGGGLS
jgi:hypothetical protein